MLYITLYLMSAYKWVNFESVDNNSNSIFAVAFDWVCVDNLVNLSSNFYILHIFWESVLYPQVLFFTWASWQHLEYILFYSTRFLWCRCVSNCQLHFKLSALSTFGIFWGLILGSGDCNFNTLSVLQLEIINLPFAVCIISIALSFVSEKKFS